MKLFVFAWVYLPTLNFIWPELFKRADKLIHCIEIKNVGTYLFKAVYYKAYLWQKFYFF